MSRAISSVPSMWRDPVITKMKIFVPMSLQYRKRGKAIVVQVKFRGKRGHFSWKDHEEEAYQMGLKEWISLRKAEMERASRGHEGHEQRLEMKEARDIYSRNPEQASWAISSLS